MRALCFCIIDLGRGDAHAQAGHPEDLRHGFAAALDHAAGEDLLSAFIEVTCVDVLFATMQSAFIVVQQAPRDEPWGMRSVIVSDADGNLICFASTLEG